MTAQGSRPRNVIVVGAGIAGLAAAWRLQRAGHTVTVLERDSHAGGRLSSEDVLPASFGNIRQPIYQKQPPTGTGPSK
ncbi:FAD-dependent oxidoreductase [Kitasatospora sp. NPDC036755]|uniref:FAD-dependent oxidoreductase n=1 Tax=Kitasatospora sp. NPDC036755 TaxID=3154600 RepID=UPI003400D665